MSFDFPASPAEDQIYTPVGGGPTYVYKSPRWFVNQTVRQVTTGDAPHANPIAGDIWWESDTGNLHIWFVDADSGQWVQVNHGPMTDLNTKVSKTGDTMTGDLTIVNSGYSSAITLDKVSGDYTTDINMTTGLVPRWKFSCTDYEDAGNSGSNFKISRYATAGTLIDTPLSISRATGVVSMPLGITCGPLTSGAINAGSNTVTCGAITSSGALGLGSNTVTCGAITSSGALGLGSNTVTCGVINSGAITSTGAIIAATTLAAKAASGNVHLWLYGPANEDRCVIYTDSATMGNAILRVNGTQSFTFANTGIFTSPSSVRAAANFEATSTIATLAATGTGTVNIRPGGVAVTTGAITVTTTTLGFFGKAAVARQTYAVPTGTISRATFATSTVTLPILAGVVMALVTDLEALGLIA